MTATEKLSAELVRLINKHPEAIIVTDVGASMFSGWGNLCKIVYHENENTIELEFG